MGFLLDHLIVEFTENECLLDSKHILSITVAYRGTGFKIALDDFGTGYSGLSRLADLRPDIINLDRAPVEHRDETWTRLSIVSSMIALSAERHVKVVVGGVERIGELDALRSVEARFIQRFCFARRIFEGIARDSKSAVLAPVHAAA